MRVWIDPERAAARDLTVDEIVASLRNNNVQVAGGAVGGPPFDDNPAAYQLSIRAQGRLDTPEEFADAIIKRDAQGRVEVPQWRHALINYPHPLLKQGLVVLDTPGLNAIGAEPELTLSLLPSAHATVFILGADTAVIEMMDGARLTFRKSGRRAGPALVSA